MTGYLGGLGQVLAAVALLLQIAVPSLHRPILLIFQNDAGALNVAYDEHALCLARGSGDPIPGAPTNQVPTRTHPNLPPGSSGPASAGSPLPTPPPSNPVTFESPGATFNSLLH